MSFEPGTVFAGDYRVVKPLNQGGMGAVYVVQQLSTGKMRALKLMHASLVDPSARAKFEQEARIGARIASEHVVEVVAAGVDPQTQAPFLVMELLEGEDLATRLERGPMAPNEAALVLEQIAHAVGAAHDAGVVHRDLKPENVFLSVSKRSTATLVVKLLDFGIAKVTDENQRNTTGAYGTPMWLAPEQTRRGEITPAADVWAFGLVAFTMLTGHPFWRSAEGANASLPNLIRDITQAPIPEASSRAREYAVGLPRGFDAWLHTALERDPRRRFANARAAWQSLAPILAATTAPVELARAPKRSSGLMVALVIAVVMLTLAIAGAAVAIVMTRSRAVAPVAATTPSASLVVAAPPSASASASASAVLERVATTAATGAASAPVIATPAPASSGETFRIGGGVSGSPLPLMDDAVRKFNGDLARSFDKCLPPTGPQTHTANIVTEVSPDGSVKSARPLYAAHAGPVLQCFIDAISRAHFVTTTTGGSLLFTLSWKHA